MSGDLGTWQKMLSDGSWDPGSAVSLLSAL